MNYAQLSRAVGEKMGTTTTGGAAALNAVIDTIAEQVTAGEKVSIPGFGTFEKTERPARTARNPRTGEPVAVPACNVPKFKPFPAFKDAVNT